MNICIVGKKLGEIQVMKPLWEQNKSIQFGKKAKLKSEYIQFNFSKKMETIHKKAKNGIIKLDMLLDNDTGNYVGYCLSSIENSFGEIEAIYVEDNYRKTGFGAKLMENAFNWFEANEVTDIS